jgi:hypothetical protein
MGGFTNGDTLRLFVDSFGIVAATQVNQGRKDSLLLPQEDTYVELMRSPSIQESVYTGVIIEYRGDAGWRVVGYDAVDPYFTIVPSNKRGAKNTIVQDNQRVIEYKEGTGTTARIAYGTVFQTRQDVYDFLISLGRYQESQGWIFDQFDESTNRMRDWSLSAREFLFWSQGPWGAGTYIQLSPLATMVKYKNAFGLIQNVGSLINGAYSILDKSGTTITLNNTDFLRLDDEISVRPLNDQGIYCLRLSTSSIEHALVFNNLTIFGDTVYNPLLNQLQSRFRAFGLRTLEWNGRLEAPGYMVTQTVISVGDRAVVKNTIVPNFDKSASDLQQLFEYNLTTTYRKAENPNENLVSEITQTVPAAESALAKHLIGYQPRSYLNNLLIDNNVAYQFYQGMIQQKGTSNSINALLRNTNVLTLNQDLNIYEEFGFRTAVYGATSKIYGVDVQLVQDQVKSNPQEVILLGPNTSDNPRDQVITILTADSRKINETPETPPFLLRNHYGPDVEDLPTAGYVLLNEVDWVVANTTELLSLYNNQSDAYFAGTGALLAAGDIVWQMIDNSRGWNIWKIVRPSWKISYTNPAEYNELQTVVTTSANHGLAVGDNVVMFGILGTGIIWNGTFTIVEAGDQTFTVNVQTQNVGSGGEVWVYRSIRFNSITERDTAYKKGTLTYKDLAYVDGSSTTPWMVYRRGVQLWIQYRREEYKVDPRYIIGSRLYNETNLNTLAVLTYYDPVKNKMPGIFDREISFKTPYDPAKYSVDGSGIYGTDIGDAWGSDQVGVVWWDLSTTRFLDYEIGTDSYRRQHWGAIAPRTSIDIYEWVRSTVPPASWQNLVAQGTDLSAIGSTNTPSGTVKNTNTYVIRQQTNSSGDLVSVYYFWVKNTTTVPDVPGRNISTSVLTSLITEPNNNNLAWWTAINSLTALIGNIGTYLNGQQTVWQVNWTSSLDLGISHKEWDLIRPVDPQSSPSIGLWSKMKDSLIEYNAVGDSVPNLRLTEMQKYGLLIRPSQTLFKTTNGARQALVQNVNTLLSAATIPPDSDTERTNWLPYFTSVEDAPPSSYQLANVRLATTPGVKTAHVGVSLVGTTMVISSLPTSGTSRIQVGWYVDGPGIGVSAQIINIVPGAAPDTLDLTLDPYATSYIVQGDIYTFTNFSTFYDNKLTGVGARLITRVSGPLTIDEVLVLKNDRILVKDQFESNENGIYLVQEIGVAGTGPLDPGTPTILVRAEDFDNPSQDLYLAQCKVVEGTENANLPYYQTNQNILHMGIDPQTWVLGIPPANWVRQVSDILARDALNYQLPVGNRVLVDANAQTNMKWTIWEWTADGNWNLVQIQGYRTPDCWNLVDWYSTGYSDLTIVNYTFDTLQERDAYLSFTSGDLVKVNNTGSGYWGLYLRSGSEWILVGAENGGIELSARLWDYETYQMGFDGGGFDSDGQGFEYDSRLELEQILDGLWNAGGTGGLLLQNTTTNQPNQVFFTMINRSLVENKFVDYTFKTSYITLRGFAETLEATPYYTTNKIDSLIDYVNEVKPYHVKIRQFVDSRRANDLYNSASTDFDKPPYNDPNSGIRILDSTKVTDQQLLSTLDAYKDWYENYQTNPELVRSIRTRMIYNRVACAQETYYAPGYSSETVINQIVADMVELYTLNTVPTAFVVKVLTDAYDRWTLFQRNDTTWNSRNPSTAWNVIGYQHNMGAIDTIMDSYHPTANMTRKDSDLLISGCAGSLTTLDGSQFNSEDAWDQSIWDNVRGWSYTADNSSIDQTISGGTAPRYFTFSGDASSTEFSLPWAPQDPNHLKIWVNGSIKIRDIDWGIRNSVANVLIALRGIGYHVNDVLTLEGGNNLVPASVKVLDVDPIGALIKVELINPGSYNTVPGAPVALLGGNGVNASVSVRWSGKTLVFTNAPSTPTRGPNIWVVENGSTFNPAVSSVLDTIFDGSGLNRPHLEAGHPEELTKIWARNSLSLSVYTHPSPGWGNVLTSTYLGDGVTDQFDIGQNVYLNSQIWVYVNGILKEYGTDYLVNTEYMRVIFLTAPSAASNINIISVGLAGASKSLGYYSIIESGQDYVLFDSVRMTGGEITQSNNPRVQITAVKGVGTTVIDGGNSYHVGDVLLYKYGESRESLSVRVLSVVTVGGTRGIISAVEIITPGYYVNLTAGVSDWFSNGSGTGAVIQVSWGVANVFVQDRGTYFAEPIYLNQSSVIPSGSSPGTGSGLTLVFGQGAIREEKKLLGDGVSTTIKFAESAFDITLLVTLNGNITYDWNFDSNDPSVIVLNFVPQLDDVVYAVAYNSELYSINNRETVTYDGSPAYNLANPPGYSPVPTKNSLVYWNNRKLRAPVFAQYTADGLAVTFAIGATPTLATDVTVWLNTQQLGSLQYTVSGSNVVFFTPPAQGSVVAIQYADPALQNYEYLIGADQISFPAWLGLAPGDQINVMVFTEDSHTSFVSETWPGSITGVYSMNNTPISFGSVQVFVNGVVATQTWDYVLANVNGTVEIRFAASAGHVPTDVVQAYYPTEPPAQPAVAFRLFTNIYDQTITQRISNASSSFLAEPILLDSTSMKIEDGRGFSDATQSSPGAVWVGSERIEYTAKSPLPTPEYPYATTLLGLRRGTLGTPNGVETVYSQTNYNGDGSSLLFLCNNFNLMEYVNDTVIVNSPNDVIVLVNGRTQILDINYTIIMDPPSKLPGTYVEFYPDSVPPFGNSNVLILIRGQDTSLTTVCHPAQTLVRDASANQNIPGGLIWPAGDKDIQYGDEPQTAFLVKEPGTRIV